MLDKYTAAIRLAQAHYRCEPGITEIFQIRTAEAESEPTSPVVLLEVNADTVPSGILPLGFGPHPASGDYPSIIVEVTPDEFRQIKKGQLRLPEGWNLGPLLPPPTPEGASR